MRTNSKNLTWTLFALALAALAALSFGTGAFASGSDSLGTSPFDFSNDTYRAPVVFEEAPRTAFDIVPERV